MSAINGPISQAGPNPAGIAPHGLRPVSGTGHRRPLRPAWARNRPEPRSGVVPQVIATVPAIAAEESRALPSRRAVNLRWLGAVALIGLLGLMLIGFALYVSMDGRLDVVEAPRAAYTGANSAEPLPRGDVLASRALVMGAKRTFRAPYAHEANGRESLVVTPFIRLSTRLLPNSVGLEDDVPPLHQAELIRSEGLKGTDAALDAVDPSEFEDTADVSTVFSPLPDTIAEPGPELPDDAAARQAQAAAEAARSLSPITTFSAQSLLGSSMFRSGPTGERSSPFTSMDVRIVPENITEVAKRPGGRTGRRPVAVDVAPGEQLAGPLRQAGAGDRDADHFAAALGRNAGHAPGSLTVEFGADAEAPSLARVTLREGDRIVASVARSDAGAVVPVYAPDPAYGVGSSLSQRLAGSPGREDEDAGDEGRPEATSLYQSLYQTALLNEIPRATIDEVLRLFAFDVDLQRAIGPDDRIDLLAMDDPEGRGHPTLLYAALVLDGERIAYWRAPPGSDSGFVDADGRSNRRMLVSKPIPDARLTSGFGTRYHPVLHYTRPHNGIDWANKIGTPVFAAGDGEVVEAGWHSGYGRHVEIRHADGFVTTYSHLSALARGLEPGVRVRLGQTIGALGQSGLATGPHLHFEVKLNGNFVNPLTVRVPRASRLNGTEFEQFRRDRTQIEHILDCSAKGACQGPG